MHAPICEQLETRILLSTIHWDGGGDGLNWSDPLNWDTDVLPAAADDVILDVAENPIIRLDISASINSLIARESLTIDQGDLTLTTTATIEAPLTLDNDAALRGGQWNLSQLHALVIERGRIYGLSVQGNIHLGSIGADLAVFDNLALDGTIRLHGANAILRFFGEQVFDTGTIHFEGVGEQIILGDVLSSLTLGPAAEIVGADGVITGNVVVNQGTITLGSSGQHLIVHPALFINEGVLQAANAGTIELAGDWINAGQATAIDGDIVISGTLVNDGHRQVLDGQTGSWTLAGGTIEGGIIELTEGTTLNRLLSDSGSNTLSDVHLVGELSLDRDADYLRIEDGLVLDGTIHISGLRAVLDFNGTQTISGGTFVIHTPAASSPAFQVRGMGTVTLDANVRLIGRVGSVFSSSGRLVNHGLIRIENTLSVNAWYFDNYGRIVVEPEAVLTIGYRWTNFGVIAVNEGRLRMRGNMTLSSIGVIERTGGTVQLEGSLDLEHGRLTLNRFTGSWDSRSGSIRNGEIAFEDGQTLSPPGSLHDIHVIGDWHVDSASSIRLEGSFFSIDGTLFLSNDGATLSFYSPWIEFRSGEVRLEQTGDLGPRIDLAYIGQTVTIGKDAVIRGIGRIRGFGAGNAPTLIVDGSLIAGLPDHPGGELEVRLGYIQNNGLFAVTSGSTLVLRADLANLSDGTLTGGQWIIEENSTLYSRGSILTNNASITLRGQNASFPALNSLAANSGNLTLENGANLAINPTDNLLTNAGRISIDPTSTLTITGDYIQTPQGSLAIGTAGPPESPFSGQLIATGSATLAGTFQLTFAKALQPNCGTDFQFISASTVNDQFDTLTLPDPPEFHKYPVLYGPSGVRLLTTSIADLDNSGTVTTTDFLAFLNFYNDGNPTADFNGDGIINTQDFIAYLNAFNHNC